MAMAGRSIAIWATAIRAAPIAAIVPIPVVAPVMVIVTIVAVIPPVFPVTVVALAVSFIPAVPNLRIMETDIDRIAWDAELFTHAPEFEDGCMVVPDRPGWGTEPDEAALRAHPANDLLNPVGLITYGRRSAVSSG